MDRDGNERALESFSVGDEIREPQQIRHNVGYAVRRAQMRVYDHFFTALADLDTTPTRYTLMLLIRENPRIRSVDLARALGMARSGMTGCVVAELPVRPARRSGRRARFHSLGSGECRTLPRRRTDKTPRWFRGRCFP